jgi:hypothetical protein
MEYRKEGLAKPDTELATFLSTIDWISKLTEFM